MYGLINSKSAGIDDILSGYLNHSSDIVISFLVIIITNIYESDIFPEQWSTGIIIPLHEKANSQLQIITGDYFVEYF